MEEKSCETNRTLGTEDSEETCVQLAPEFSKRLSLSDDDRPRNSEDKTIQRMNQCTYESVAISPSTGNENIGTIFESADKGQEMAIASANTLTYSSDAPKKLSQPQNEPAVISKATPAEQQGVFPETDPHTSGTGSSGVSGASSVLVTQGLSQEPGLSESPQYTCQCDLNFKSPQYLANHRRWACRLKEKKAQCEICNAWFASEPGLRRHIRHVHGGNFKCDACGVHCKNKLQLTRHWLDAHFADGEDAVPGTFRCFKCDRTDFQSKYDLEVHWLHHKYEKRQKRISKLSPPVLTTSSQDTLSSGNVQTSSQGLSTNFQPQQHLPPHLPQGPPLPHWHAPGAPTHPPIHLQGHFQRPPYFMHPPPPPHPVPPPPPPFPPSLPHMIMPPHPYLGSHISSHYNQTPSDMPLGNASPHPSAPRHDHVYTEPTSLPHWHQPVCHRGHHLYGHGGKMKWKKYLKLMLNGLVPPLWSENEPGFFQRWARPWLSEQGPVAPDLTAEKSFADDEFKIACKFCDKVIKRDWIAWHQKKECPVLAAHRCGVCNKVFRKRNLLLKHIQEQNHYQSSAARSSNLHSDVNSAMLSNLQQKMNDALVLNTGADALQNPPPKSLVVMQDNVTGQGQAVLAKPSGDMARNDAETGDTREVVVRCNVCMANFSSGALLQVHLQEHVDKVELVQKVRDWNTEPANSEAGVDFAESVSVADSEITSTTGSAFTFGTASSVYPGSTASPNTDHRWTKPHKKRSSHHHGKHRKGEISVCDFCGDQFAFHKDLEFHIKTKHPNSKLQCPVCHKNFSWKKRGKFYERHLESHYGVKIFKHKCEHCDKTFLEKSKLQAHIAALHTQELLYKCSDCGKSYANKSSLVRHRRYHTGTKPYKCSECSEEFMEKRELMRHYSTHTGKAPFSCDVCGQDFTLKTSMTAHKKKKHPTCPVSQPS